MDHGSIVQGLAAGEYEAMKASLCHAADTCAFDPACPFIDRCERADEPELTDEQIGRLKADWERMRHGHVRLLTPLPRRVRLRLAVHSAVDRAAIRLCDHGWFGAAERLWRAFGMWR